MNDPAPAQPDMEIAVILPCFNEAAAVSGVIAAFRASLPTARIVVFDNNSTDGTVDAARRAGAEVRFVTAQGKGHVIRQAFARLDADIYVLADGDGTYDAASAPRLIEHLVDSGLDMVVGSRQEMADKSYPDGHRLGNRLFNRVVRTLFGPEFTDIFSGYRICSRPFVKSFPALATGFETETEMSLHAIQLGLPCREVKTPYFERVAGTASKLRTVRDGLRILWFIVRLVKHTRPLLFFLALSATAALLSLLVGMPVIVEFLASGLVPRLPTAIAAASLMVIAAIGVAVGVVLDSVAYAQRELKRLAYLSIDRNLRPLGAPDNGLRARPTNRDNA